ncbi:replication protein [Lactobacillus sp. ESL0679]|uniref:replication protein n=1 Tax=Lactobacillus sp. ESL0679 TaxID=2983209 RepID=UPI0023F888AC|nr:replication protein [Lactobacillus sp. ESL0679]MDF7683839.1 replication protein [Lactobacillus sp. ESL0679]
MEKEKKERRSRKWTLVIYPDSAPENWRQVISNMHVAWIESPCHDKDKNPDNTVKKAHWHILLMFGSDKSFRQIKEIADELNAPIPQPCRNVVGMVRYFAHIDNPEKHQYKPSDIVGHCGADPQQYLETASQKKADRYKRIKDMMDFVDDQGITEFADLLRYARVKHFDDWFQSLCDDSAFVMGQYVKSVRYSAEKEK